MNNKSLVNALKDISEHDFTVLGYSLQSANWCRNVMKKFNISDKEMAEKMKLTPLKLKHYKNGAYEYSVNDWAQLQCIEMEYDIEAARKKHEGSMKVGETKSGVTTTIL